MGLTASASGRGAFDAGLALHPSAGELVFALAGNPNVGKSTVFNALTGLRQHTGNWSGKTVSSAQGEVSRDGRTHILIDLPGTYSLLAHSAEEEVTRDFLCFGAPDCAIAVADATCLERNLNLVLQMTELCPKTVLCLNLMDEAQKKHILIDIAALEKRLGIPVIPCRARQSDGLDELMAAAVRVARGERPTAPPPIRYPKAIEEGVAALLPLLPEDCPVPRRWLALRLLEGDPGLLASLKNAGISVRPQAVETARRKMALDSDEFRDRLVASIVLRAEEIALSAVEQQDDSHARDRRLDRLFTSRRTGIPVMLLLLAGVFFLTIEGANVPSAWLNARLLALAEPLRALLAELHAPPAVTAALVDGVWLVLATVVSVMLPPMAIFFPLFTLLEDAGYLPRVAFNLDHAFQRAHACGKQCLTMCMGFGCNAAGVVGCRIIDSPRERLIAILTNSFVPCNGRFPRRAKCDNTIDRPCAATSLFRKTIEPLPRFLVRPQFIQHRRARRLSAHLLDFFAPERGYPARRPPIEPCLHPNLLFPPHKPHLGAEYEKRALTHADQSSFCL